MAQHPGPRLCQDRPLPGAYPCRGHPLYRPPALQSDNDCISLCTAVNMVSMQSIGKSEALRHGSPAAVRVLHSLTEEKEGLILSPQARLPKFKMHACLNAKLVFPQPGQSQSPSRSSLGGGGACKPPNPGPLWPGGPAFTAGPHVRNKHRCSALCWKDCPGLKLEVVHDRGLLDLGADNMYSVV